MSEAAFGGDLFTSYPHAPGWKENTTSREAAKAAAPHASNIRDAILKAIASSIGGLTADEASAIVGCKPAYGRPRVSELRAEGKVTPVGRRRNPDSNLSAIVWGLNR